MTELTWSNHLIVSSSKDERPVLSGGAKKERGCSIWFAVCFFAHFHTPPITPIINSVYQDSRCYSGGCCDTTKTAYEVANQNEFYLFQYTVNKNCAAH